MRELLGLPVAKQITERLAARTEKLVAQGIVPKLAIVRLGENAGDLFYEKGATSRMNKIGGVAESHALPLDASQTELEALLTRLSDDESVHGILMMRPLPKTLNEARAIACIAPAKDVDGMTEGSLAKVYSGFGEGFAPCTAEAVLAILDYYEVALEGASVAVLGRSLVIGKPVAQLLLARNATVTTCHSKTPNLKEVCQGADIIVSCMGRAHMIDASYIKAPCCVIDVSTNDDGKGGITGDIDAVSLDEGTDIALTPVPRGVGSVTTSILATHVVESAERSAIL